jgi:hypothetical protein
MGLLGQSAPAATTATPVYTVPVQKRATVMVYGCERGGGTPTYRLALREDGDTLANAHYIVYDLAFTANAAVAYGPFELDETDIVQVYASDGNTSWTVTGVEELKEDQE